MNLPDLPRWVEAHGIAADPQGWQRALGDGFAVGLDRAKLVVIGGEADPDATAALARACPGARDPRGARSASSSWRRSVAR